MNVELFLVPMDIPDLTALSLECRKICDKVQSGKITLEELIPFLDKYVIGGVDKYPLDHLPTILTNIQEQILKEMQKLVMEEAFKLIQPTGRTKNVNPRHKHRSKR